MPLGILGHTCFQAHNVQAWISLPREWGIYKVYFVTIWLWKTTSGTLVAFSETASFQLISLCPQFVKTRVDVRPMMLVSLRFSNLCFTLPFFRNPLGLISFPPSWLKIWLSLWRSSVGRVLSLGLTPTARAWLLTRIENWVLVLPWWRAHRGLKTQVATPQRESEKGCVRIERLCSPASGVSPQREESPSLF